MEFHLENLYMSYPKTSHTHPQNKLAYPYKSLLLGLKPQIEKYMATRTIAGSASVSYSNAFAILITQYLLLSLVKRPYMSTIILTR